MPVTPSRRGRIMANLQKQLETITVANGYSITVNKVTTVVKNWADTPAPETPVIYIIDGSTNPKYNAGRLVEWEWQVALFVVMKDRSQMEMEDHISDILQCLSKNHTLSVAGEIPGPAAYIVIDDITTDNQLFSEIEGSQLFRIVLKIKYTGDWTNPR